MNPTKEKKQRNVVLYRVIFFSPSSFPFTMSRHTSASVWTPCLRRPLPTGNVCAWTTAPRMTPVNYRANTTQALCKQNLEGGANDLQLKNLAIHYPELIQIVGQELSK